jgi:transposase
VITHDSLKLTYSQDWPAYNKAQTVEKEQVRSLLQGLCEGIVQPPQTKGRHRLLLSDVVYGSVMKVYTTVSGRRASTDIRDCQERGLIDHAPSYNSIFNYLQREELTPLFKTLIEESASPLKAVESNFAVDATGFGTCTYTRWYDHKYGKVVKQQNWLKAHAMVGVRTNVVTSIEVTEGDVGDCPQLVGLIKTTDKNFDIKEVSADKAYLSHKNLQVIANVGAQPYIQFKSNSQGKGSEQWQKLWHLFWFKRHEFDQHYHLRSNVESSFSAIKRKFGPTVRSKLFTAQVNEVLAKILCYNLSVLVHEIHELGIEPEFWGEPALVSTH